MHTNHRLPPLNCMRVLSAGCGSRLLLFTRQSGCRTDTAAMLASLLSSRQCIAQRPFTAALPSSRVARPMVMTCVAKRSKASELRGLSTEDINAQVEEAKKELFSLRIKFAKREEYKTSEKKKLRRKVAQLLTIKRERELAEGISRRESLAVQRHRLVEAGFGNVV